MLVAETDPVGDLFQVRQLSAANDPFAFAAAGDRINDSEKFFRVAIGQFFWCRDFGGDQKLSIVTSQHWDATNERCLLLPLQYSVSIHATVIEFRSDGFGIGIQQVIDGMDTDCVQSLSHSSADGGCINNKTLALQVEFQFARGLSFFPRFAFSTFVRSLLRLDVPCSGFPIVLHKVSRAVS